MKIKKIHWVLSAIFDEHKLNFFQDEILLSDSHFHKFISNYCKCVFLLLKKSLRESTKMSYIAKNAFLIACHNNF